MRRIAVINQKGGVGKTTTAANLGAALAAHGARVLLVDLDPQAHLSLHFGVELKDDRPSIYDVLTASMPVQSVAVRVRDNVTLIPADIDLAGAEAELVSVTGREVLLREALDPLDSGYDCVMIDCPPSLGVLTINALVASIEVIIPLQAHFLALQGLSKLLDTVTLVRQRINQGLRVSGIALCMHDSTTRLAGEVVEDLRVFLEATRGTGVAWEEARIYRTFIRRNIKLAESSSFGQTVFDYAPRSNGAIDYAKLAVEVFGDIIGLQQQDKSQAGLNRELKADESRQTKRMVDGTGADGNSDEPTFTTNAPHSEQCTSTAPQQPPVAPSPQPGAAITTPCSS
jgi:chromosome partitioning protein